jgi:hypothetical protein
LFAPTVVHRNASIVGGCRKSNCFERFCHNSVVLDSENLTGDDARDGEVAQNSPVAKIRHRQLFHLPTNEKQEL